MSDLHQKLRIVPAGGHHHDSRIMIAIAVMAIAAAFLLSVAIAVISITQGVKTAASGKLPTITIAPISTPATTGSADRS
jgi:hypothetical protein